RYIEGLAKELNWVEENGEVDKKVLSKFVEKQTGVKVINWLTSPQASKVIEGLKAIKEKDGKRSGRN
ncbi:MAG: phage protein GemA/Gp16 family protein, partial [Anaerotignaceae bacterium]